MASVKQIEANRRNSLRSTGPRTAEGKARVATNALVHGMAGESTDLGTAWSAEFAARRAAWAEEVRPRSVEAGQALDVVVASTIRMEVCGSALDVLAARQVARARLGWDDDRRNEAATLLAGIAESPLVIASQLASTRHGADLLIEAWTLLGVAIEDRGELSASESSTALDLLGVPAGFRGGRTALDPPAGLDRAAWLRSLVRREVARLRDRRADSLDELDDLDRRCAEIEATVVLTAPAALVLRYERDAWRRFQTALRAAKAPAPSPDGREIPTLSPPADAETCEEVSPSSAPIDSTEVESPDLADDRARGERPSTRQTDQSQFRPSTAGKGLPPLASPPAEPAGDGADRSRFDPEWASPKVQAGRQATTPG